MSFLENLDFQPVLIVDMFRPHKGRRLIAAHRKPGTTPFVGGSASYNSITGFSNIEPLFPGGWLTLVYNGSVGQTRLQPAPFFASDDVIALEPLASGISHAALLVCASIIQRECTTKYSYGSKLNLQRLKRQTVLVPTITRADGTKEVDWDGMHRLGTELLNQVITNTLSARKTRLVDDGVLPELKFKPMFITDVFDSVTASQSWYDKNKLCVTGVATYPFVSRTKMHNGIDTFCASQDSPPEAGNAITIGLDTQTIGYQPVAFYTGQNVQVLRHQRLNESNALVLASLLREQMRKFSWGGNGATLGRLRATRIMVPVISDASGEDAVDWDGMSAYGYAIRVRTERAIAPVLARTVPLPLVHRLTDVSLVVDGDLEAAPTKVLKVGGEVLEKAVTTNEVFQTDETQRYAGNSANFQPGCQER